MATTEFVQAAIEAARVLALRKFARDSDRDGKVADAMYYAWKNAATAPPGVTVGMVLNLSFKHAFGYRGLGLSVRSIEHPRNNLKRDPESALHVENHFRVGENPAVIVQVRLDFLAWLDSLSPRNAAIALDLAMGRETCEVAQDFHVSPARVSQLRRELWASWRDFTA